MLHHLKCQSAYLQIKAIFGKLCELAPCTTLMKCLVCGVFYFSSVLGAFPELLLISKSSTCMVHLLSIQCNKQPTNKTGILWLSVVRL